jgi:hypothetical protein
MVSKGKAVLALLLLAAQGAGTIRAQAKAQVSPAGQSATKASSNSANNPQTPAATNSQPSGSNAGTGATSGTTPNCTEGPCDAQPAHITIATAAPAPAPWPWPDRVAWVARILLAVLGYVGIMLALSTLRKIQRQSQYAEVAAQAAADSAQAALLHARPSYEPSAPGF